MKTDALPERPVLRRDRHVECLSDALLCLGEDVRHVFTSGAYARVAEQLDGHRSPSDVVAALAGRVPAPVAWYVLDDLRAKGLLVEHTPAVPRPEAGWWDAAGVAPVAARREIATRPVALESLGPDPAPLRDLLVAAGFRVGPGGLRILLVEDYLQPGIAAHNQAALADGVPWLLAQPNGATPWIGPLFRPGTGPCWACMAERLQRNRQLEDFALRHAGRDAPLPKAVAALPSTLRLAAAIIATEAMLFAAGATPESDGWLLTFDTVAARRDRHPVTRRPHCPACGDPLLYRPDAPIRIRSVPCDVGLRGPAQPEEILQRLAPCISPITGVVTALEDHVGHVEGLMYAYTARHHFVLGQDTLPWMLEGLRTRTGGKGATPSEAKLGAVCEAIERTAGVWRGIEPVRHGTQADIGADALDLRDCLQFSEAQYDQRAVANGAGGSFFHRVPHRYDPELAIDWAPLWSLTHERRHWLPAAFCWFAHPDSRRHFFCTGDTNGCASGTTPEEAMLHAFLELVERDAVAIWWYNRLRRPALDLDGFASPLLVRLRRHYAAEGRDVHVLDLTADLGIPVFASVSRRLEAGAEDIVFGFGAHLDPDQALMRAVAEMNQFLPAVGRRDAAGETLYAWPEEEALRFWKTETLARQPWLAPDPGLAVRRREDFPAPRFADLGQALQHCVALCRAHGLEFLAQDQTRPDIDLPVFRVVVPGLRHFWRRLGPGRLYDVPVRMGWRQTACAESDLNPYSVFV